MRWVKPLDEDAILMAAGSHQLLVTLEENAVAGGAGSAVSEFLSAQDNTVGVLHFGIPDEFIEHGSQQQQLQWAGLDSQDILQRIHRRLAATTDRATQSLMAPVTRTGTAHEEL